MMAVVDKFDSESNATRDPRATRDTIEKRDRPWGSARPTEFRAGNYWVLAEGLKERDSEGSILSNGLTLVHNTLIGALFTSNGARPSFCSMLSCEIDSGPPAGAKVLAFSPVTSYDHSCAMGGKRRQFSVAHKYSLSYQFLTHSPRPLPRCPTHLLRSRNITPISMSQSHAVAKHCLTTSSVGPAG